MKKILIAGVPYGQNNVGDVAILAVLINSIGRVNDRIEIIVSTCSQNEIQKKLNQFTLIN